MFKKQLCYPEPLLTFLRAELLTQVKKGNLLIYLFEYLRYLPKVIFSLRKKGVFQYLIKKLMTNFLNLKLSLIEHYPKKKANNLESN